jgi:hypothetical protein
MQCHLESKPSRKKSVYKKSLPGKPGGFSKIEIRIKLLRQSNGVHYRYLP